MTTGWMSLFIGLAYLFMAIYAGFNAFGVFLFAVAVILFYFALVEWRYYR